ncbi:hypothetical protein KAI32_04385, partial [Candidatus Pacearchaeota archaeon]|nr:hypothetical protein [Candidatus Pacearchaeota archaeon]
RRLSKLGFIKKSHTKSMTDLDTLYEILKRKKEVDIEDIGKVFKVNPEIALEWSEILEDGDLAIIDYPRFGKPILRLFEKNNEEESVSKDDVKDKKDIESKKVKKEIKNIHRKDAVSTKKIISPKKIPKKVIRKNRKVEKKMEKKVRKKKVEGKSKKK